MQVGPESEVHLQCFGGIHFNYDVPQTWVRDVVVEGLQPAKPPKRATYRRPWKIRAKYDSPTDGSSDESSSSDVTTDAESQPSAAVISDSKSQDRKKYLQIFKINLKNLHSREDTTAEKKTSTASSTARVRHECGPWEFFLFRL